MDTKSRGRLCEDLAANWYKDNGYSVVQRNYRSASGEIDIICRKDSTLVFSEVKSIPVYWDAGDMEMKIPPAKVMRIKRTASDYLARCSNEVYHSIRFDAVFVAGNSIRCIEGAF